jgi:IS30 family transposase
MDQDEIEVFLSLTSEVPFEKMRLALLLFKDCKKTEIARKLGKSRTTIEKELAELQQYFTKPKGYNA